MVEITGLPPHLKNYSLAYFSYGATCEGVTIEAEILNSPEQKPTIGFPSLKNGGAEIISCAQNKTFDFYGEEGEYLDWNPEFKAKFYEVFGVKMWAAFENCCLLNKNVLDLKVKMHYNLS